MKLWFNAKPLSDDVIVFNHAGIVTNYAIEDMATVAIKKKFHFFFLFSALISATVGAARIFSYHLLPRLLFKLESEELHRDPRDFEARSTK